jgi:hypothetical protein
MSPSLRSLAWQAHDRCIAQFLSPVSDQLIDVTFALVRSRGQSTGIIVADAEPDVFVEFDGTAAEVRGVVNAIISFCLAAQGELET